MHNLTAYLILNMVCYWLLPTKLSKFFIGKVTSILLHVKFTFNKFIVCHQWLGMIKNCRSHPSPDSGYYIFHVWTMRFLIYIHGNDTCKLIFRITRYTWSCLSDAILERSSLPFLLKHCGIVNMSYFLVIVVDVGIKIKHLRITKHNDIFLSIEWTAVTTPITQTWAMMLWWSITVDKPCM